MLSLYFNYHSLSWCSCDIHYYRVANQKKHWCQTLPGKNQKFIWTTYQKSRKSEVDFKDQMLRCQQQKNLPIVAGFIFEFVLHYICRISRIGRSTVRKWLFCHLFVPFSRSFPMTTVSFGWSCTTESIAARKSTFAISVIFVLQFVEIEICSSDIEFLPLDSLSNGGFPKSHGCI